MKRAAKILRPAKSVKPKLFSDALDRAEKIVNERLDAAYGKFVDRAVPAEPVLGQVTHIEGALRVKQQPRTAAAQVEKTKVQKLVDEVYSKPSPPLQPLDIEARRKKAQAKRDKEYEEERLEKDRQRRNDVAGAF